MKLEWLFLLTIAWFPALADDYSDVQVFDPHETRSRLLTVNGNMFFHAGKDKNITFRTNGGSIWLSDTDISNLPPLAKFTSLEEAHEKLKGNVDILIEQRRVLMEYSIYIANKTKNLYSATRNISIDVKSLKEWRKEKSTRDARVRKFISRISKALRTLLEVINYDGCDESPCKGGGTCIPRFGKKVTCICPPHVTGEFCDTDLDECSTLEVPCQNNGTCQNVNNGYICQCPKGYHGRRCQFEHSSCRKTPGLCGNGFCVEADIDSSADYKCICNEGYKPSDDPNNPTCVDVDECASSPCHPGVDCINLPGSFQCTGCPKGYHGNGRMCVDVDECARSQYPCSSAPLVPCFNTIGSYHCGTCPAGYRGDGKQCKKVSPCDDKPCYPTAECKEDSDAVNANGYYCVCPSEYIGNGIGAEGCYKSNSTVCNANRCLNGGTCMALSEDSFRCDCSDGYLGSLCEKVSPCKSTPCQNGGYCRYEGQDSYTCDCPPSFYGENCEMEEDTACGRHYDEPYGNFTFPDDFDGAYNGICDIVIQPPGNNEYLQITFTRFESMFTSLLRGPTNCSYTNGNITLFDGDNENAPMLTTLCGPLSFYSAPKLNEPISLTGTKAMLRYQGKNGVFSVEWKLKKRTCSYRTNMPGSLTVPPHHMDTLCEWFISAPSDKHIEIDIPILEMTTGGDTNCTTNELKIYDGYTNMDMQKLFDICESNNDTITLRSTGPFLTILFKNNVLYGTNSPIQAGFSMKYRFITPEYTCGGDIINSDRIVDFEGFITSPNYGNFYPKNLHCTWTINVWPEENNTKFEDQSIKFEVQELDIPSSSSVFLSQLEDMGYFNPYGFNEVSRHRRPPNRQIFTRRCLESFLRIIVDGNVIDRCNNQQYPKPLLMFNSPTAVVHFHSGQYESGKGFKLKYSRVCQKTLTGNGTIQSWNYPNGGRSGKCTYIIKAGLSHAILIKFQTVRFSTVSPAQCFMKANNSEVLDYVEFVGGTDNAKQLHQKYYCSKFPLIEGNQLTMSAQSPFEIVFSSSGDPRNKGISLEYQTIDVGCGGVFTSSSGIITSPNYPDKYLPHMHCVYQINALWSKQVRLTFEHFDMEIVSNDDCSYDRVEVYDRYNSESDKGKLLGKFCGSQLPPTILSTRYQMAVVFISDRSVAGSGFSARFESVDVTQDCDRTFTEPSGIISFDGSSGRFGHCEFHISLSVKAGIIFKINNASIPCDKGKLQIRNGLSTQSPGFPALWGDSQVCDSHMYWEQLRSHGNRIYMKLIATDSSKISFNISYEQIESSCGGRISGVTGSIASPQYPLSDNRPMECKWTIAVSLGNRVRLTLAMLDDLNASDDNGFCTFFASNRLDFYDGPSLDSRLLRRYCKKAVASPPFDSNDHDMAVVYKQYGGVGKALFGFLAHFSTECTGIVHTAYSGSIQSPGYPDKVYSNRFCSWTIQVPRGNRIGVDFKHYVIEERFRYGLRECSQNYLSFGKDEVAQATIKAGNSINVTNSLTTTCNVANKPIRVKSASNVLHITFQSKGNEENNFWLTWHTIGCGGDIISPQNITVTKADMDSESDIYECNWKIVANPGFKIKLSVNEFSIFRRKPDGGCNYTDDSYSGFELYAGYDNSSDAPFESICDGVKDQAFTSHSNEMFIRMKVHKNDITTPGANVTFFSANVQFVETSTDDKDDCGGIIQVSPDGVSSIHSPRFPAEYPRGTYCEWTFKAPTGYRLQLTLKEFNTPNGHPQRSQSTWRPISINNLTCQPPLPAIEGAITIFEYSNVTLHNIIDRICLDISEPKIFEINTDEARIRFQGASAPRTYMSAEDDIKKRIGFVLEAKALCGGTIYADSEENSIDLINVPVGICNITIIRKNEDDSGLMLRIDEITKREFDMRNLYPNSQERSFLDITLDENPTTSRQLFGHSLAAGLRIIHEEFRADNRIRLGYVRRSVRDGDKLQLAYSTVVNSCGLTLKQPYGFVSAPEITDNFECTWVLKTSPGNRIMISAVKVKLPFSPNCTESYFEVRRYNESGPLVKRMCEDKAVFIQSFHSYFIRARYVKPDADDLDFGTDVVKPRISFRYSKMKGSRIEAPGLIENPDFPDNTFTMWSIPGEKGKGVLLSFEKFAIPDGHVDSTKLKSGLYILGTDGGFDRTELLEGGKYTKYVGFEKPADILIKDQGVLIVMSGLPPVPDLGFRLRWDRVNETYNLAKENEDSKTVFTCGGVLPEPTYEWQEIRSPTVEGDADAGYPPNQRCRWIIERPFLSGLSIKIEKMDLENVGVGCMFDYVSLVADKSTEDTDMNFGTKFCKKRDVNATINYSYNKFLNVFFVSDKSRGGSGFIIKYRKTCQSFDFIKPSESIFVHELTTPPPSEEECSWIIVIASNRRIRINILELDLYESPDCTVDYLGVNNRNLAVLVPNSTRYCGKITPDQRVNKTIQNGRVFLKYINKKDDGRTELERSRDKFVVRIEEVLEDCSNVHLELDDSNKSMMFYTPGYPSMLPNSMDCEYTLRVPTGLRMQFTVNPREFILESSSDTCDCDACDWLEIRDGASAHSPLVGKFCGSTAPSTIYSTGNMMYVRIRTDSYAQSHGFTANFSIASCGGTVVLGENQTTYLRSPNYPEMYQDKSECQWSVHVPNTHMIQMRLNHFWLTYSENCSSSYVAVRDGNATAPYLIEPQCNNHQYDTKEYRTMSSAATVNFKANVTTLIRAGRQFCKNKKCGFELEVKTSEEACGGVITDNHGTITPPGFPDKLLPHVKCSWELSAGAGHRYLLEFEFTDPDVDGFYQQRFLSRGQFDTCFPDLIMHNGGAEYERSNLYSTKYFCRNESSWISESDKMTVVYSDMYSRDFLAFKGHLTAENMQFYVPFRINYTKVPEYVDEYGCTKEIKTNHTSSIGYHYHPSNFSNDGHYCHYSVVRPAGYETTVIIISNYSDGQSSIVHSCYDWNSFIDIKSVSAEPYDYNERICSGKLNEKEEKLVRILNHQNLDINIFTLTMGLLEESSQRFNLTILFQKCGGYITKPNSGVITSPNFGEGRSYLPDSHCEWTLVAPEGQVVEITITDLDVEFEPDCSHDSLIVGEGKSNNVIQRFCLSESMNNSVITEHKERHSKVRSRSQYLRLAWITDSKTEGRGFRLEYEFVDVADGCGFHTNDMTGVIHSPNYPQAYPSDQECIWDVQVPRGYHVELKFITFDIEASDNCEKDSVTISEEHNAKGEEPLSGNYFMFLSEEKRDPMCGYHVPEPVRLASNRMRVNFTANGKTNGKGFKAEWNAVCGAEYTMSHYTIESPHYPNYYPNEDMVCEYLISPTGEYANGVIVLNIADFMLSDVNDLYSTSGGACESDYLEISEPLKNRVVKVYCGGETVSDEPIVIKGAAGIRFVTKKFPGIYENKNRRGFRLTYQIQKCGGDIQLGYNEYEDRHKWVDRIVSPAFPLEYPHDLDCKWNVSAPSDRVILVKMQHMDLEESSECEFDYLELFDGTVASNMTRMAKYCDKSMIPKQELKTKTNNLLVNFFTDASHTGEGFVMVVTATLGPKHGCGGSLTARDDWQTLEPPRDSNGSYLDSLHCGWTIAGPDDSMIEVELVSMDTEKLLPVPGVQPERVCVDSLSIYDGYRSFSPLIAKDLCTETVHTLPARYHSSHKVIHVLFESDVAGGGKGFELKYRIKKNECGKWLTAKESVQTETYVIKSESEKHDGQSVQRCQWVIQSKEQVPIWLQLRDLNIPAHGYDCAQYYIEIRDVGILSKCEHPGCAQKEGEKRVIRYCDKAFVPPFISNTMAVQIITSALITDTNKATFSFDYRLLENCNRTIDLAEFKTGRLTSPNYPNFYSVNTTCTTLLQGTKGKVLVAFRAFKMESGGSTLFRRPNVSRWDTFRNKYFRITKCNHDYLQILEDGTNTTKRYCGNTVPPTYLSESPSLEMFFKTDDTVNIDGFDATYYTTKPTKDPNEIVFHTVYDDIGVVTNIEYPNKYNKSTIQKWSIMPPTDHECTVTLDRLGIGEKVADTPCFDMDEYVEIKQFYDDVEKNNDVRLRGCFLPTPTTLTFERGNGRRLDILFKSDERDDNDGIGFRIEWYCHLD